MTSTRSSMLARPAVLPYSSTTMTMWVLSCCISRIRSLTGLVSGTKRMGADQLADGAVGALVFIQLEHVAHMHEADDLIDGSFVDRDARILFVDDQLRAVLRAWRPAEMATILGRGVMTSRTTLSPNSTTDWISLRSSSSMRPSSVPAEISASMFSACVGGSSRRWYRRSISTSDWKKPSTATSGLANRPSTRMSGASGSQPLRRRAAVEHLRDHVGHHDHGEPGGDGGFEHLRPSPGLPVGEDQEVQDADQQEAVCLTRVKRSGAVFGVEVRFCLPAFP